MDKKNSDNDTSAFSRVISDMFAHNCSMNVLFQNANEIFLQKGCHPVCDNKYRYIHY